MFVSPFKCFDKLNQMQLDFSLQKTPKNSHYKKKQTEDKNQLIND